jgi:hypothetical protein
MAAVTVRIMDRRWAAPDDPNDMRVVLTFCDPATPGRCYETAPCANTAAAEAAAIEAAAAARKAAGQDYPGKGSGLELVTVTV